MASLRARRWFWLPLILGIHAGVWPMADVWPVSIGGTTIFHIGHVLLYVATVAVLDFVYLGWGKPSV